MSVTTQSMISELLKQNYRPIMQDSIFQDVTLLDLIPVYKGDVRGSDVRHAVELERSHGGGARGAGEFLPVDYPETFKQSTVSLTRFYYTLSLDGFVIELFKKGDGSFVDYLDKRMRNSQRDAANQLNRIAHQDGTGVVAKINGTHTATNTVTLKHVNGYSFGSCQFLEEGDSIVVLNTSGGAPRVSRIATIDWANQQITLKDSATLTASDDELVVFGDSHSNSWGNPTAGTNKEAVGLRGIIGSSGVFQGIDATAYRRWRSTIIDKTAAPVPYDWTHVTRISSAAMYKGSTQPANTFLLMHPAMLEEHQRLVDPDVRYEPRDFQLTKQLSVPTFQVLGKQIPVRTSIHMGFQEIVALNAGELERLELGPMDWDDSGGSELKPIQGKDAVYAFLRYYFAFAARTRNHFARFDGIQVDTTFVDVLQSTS